MYAVRLGTRGSKLARRQADAVAQALRRAQPSLHVQSVIITADGDRSPAAAPGEAGFKGLFTSVLEDRLLAGAIDIAVHSLKDLPTQLAAGLSIGAILTRENPCDVLLSAKGHTLTTLPAGARLGTSSLRRAAQVRARRPDIMIEPLRGNIETRVSRMHARRLDGIVLAYAGIKRLGLEHLISERIDPDVLLPAAGQGAIAVEYSETDKELGLVLQQIDDQQTRSEVLAERSFLERLGAGCHVPAACLATSNKGRIMIRGLVASPDGRRVCKDALEAAAEEAVAAGRALAEKLLSAGADRILKNREPAE